MAMFEGLKLPAHLAVTFANDAKNDASGWPTVAYAHAMHVSSYSLMWFTCCSAALAKMVNTGNCAALVNPFGQPAFANTHAAFERSCKVKSTTTCSVELANATKNYVSLEPAVAIVHAMLLRSCVLKSPTHHSAALADAVNNCKFG
eukprot:gnl/MRDRNA2_/MRDRNA2_77595_c0_seq1.p1 gnl/MRDRNA2_/MRDRNA2_77595_c0~~gnl/MRDRNA2_/MRDRNA2_77595_c0_seq1.p1  ORF type:complete len:146 (-),score=25.86 gnl/MRDRNA2_/MRDRNA2_77595_c0_seq1:383-820(-)